MYNKKTHMERVKWFLHDRFGMFIHWGLYAIPARGEWVRHFEETTNQDYEPYFKEFNPSDYNPQKWAKLAKKAGMKYAVMTAKHHDGFCLFDTKYTDYKSTNTPFGRDAIKEYVEAFRNEGIKVGLYYSLLDWHHEDYPHYDDERHPQRKNQAYSNENRDFNRYLEYMHNQIKELCTNYGTIDIFWFDFSYAQLRGEAWKATELVTMIRSYQPNVLIDNRLEVSGLGFGSLVSEHPTDYCGDFVSPEQIIPPNGIKDYEGNLVPWESCITMNNNWGYHATDKFFKSSSSIILKLIECVSKGGNMILNVGPDAQGRIPKQSVKILKNIGKWLNNNGESIYGCGLAPLKKPETGRITANKNRLYYHITEPQIGYIPLHGINAKNVKKIRLLHDNSELLIHNDWITENYPDIVFVSLGENPALPIKPSTVIEVTLC